jgi:hypothetical protein
MHSPLIARLIQNSFLFSRLWDSTPQVRSIVRWADNIARCRNDTRKALTQAEFVDGGTVDRSAGGQGRMTTPNKLFLAALVATLVTDTANAAPFTGPESRLRLS